MFKAIFLLLLLLLLLSSLKFLLFGYDSYCFDRY